MKKPAGPIRTRAIGDLVLLAVLAAFVVLYFVDAIRASKDVLNLILVLPLSIAVLGLCVAQFVIGVREIRGRGPAAASREAPIADAPEAALRSRLPVADAPEPAQRSTLPFADVLRVVGLFAVYVLTSPWLGFDIGTCLFLAAFLWLHGERRWSRVAGYSLGFGLLIALFFSRMLPYPMPMLLLGGA